MNKLLKNNYYYSDWLTRTNNCREILVREWEANIIDLGVVSSNTFYKTTNASVCSSLFINTYAMKCTLLILRVKQIYHSIRIHLTALFYTGTEITHYVVLLHCDKNIKSHVLQMRKTIRQRSTLGTTWYRSFMSFRNIILQYQW